jgi:uncharacterized phage-associated protein
MPRVPMFRFPDAKGGVKRRSRPMPHSAETIASYILSLQDDVAKPIFNMKLQKLLYYAQGICVAVSGADAPLFSDKIHAWDRGPVIITVYQKYCHYQKKPLPREDRPNLNEYDSFVVEEVYRVFGKFSNSELCVMTHAEMPRKKHYLPNKLNIEIPRADLQTFFKQYIKVQESAVPTNVRPRPPRGRLGRARTNRSVPALQGRAL